jgi:hypothetical protein
LRIMKRVNVCYICNLTALLAFKLVPILLILCRTAPAITGIERKWGRRWILYLLYVFPAHELNSCLKPDVCRVAVLRASQVNQLANRSHLGIKSVANLNRTLCMYLLPFRRHPTNNNNNKQVGRVNNFNLSHKNVTKKHLATFSLLR